MENRLAQPEKKSSIATSINRGRGVGPRPTPLGSLSGTLGLAEELESKRDKGCSGEHQKKRVRCNDVPHNAKCGSDDGARLRDQTGGSDSSGCSLGDYLLLYKITD